VANRDRFRSRFVNFTLVDGKETRVLLRHTAQCADFVANAGASIVRHRMAVRTGRSWHAATASIPGQFRDDESVPLFDAYAFVDVPKTVFKASTRPASPSA